MSWPLGDPLQGLDDKPALAGETRLWTYGELRRAAEEQAAWLRTRGVGARTRVVVRASSDERLAVLIHALWLLGASLVPLNLRWTEAEIADVVRRVSPAILLRHDGGGWSVEPLLGGEVKADRDGEPAQLILFTSGTTGRPKGALISFRAIEASARSSAQALGYTSEERWLCCLPLYHIAGLSILYRSAIYGSTVLLHERFDPIRVNHALDNEGVTVVSLVPTQLHALLDARGGKPFAPTLKCLLLGGARAPRALLARALTLGAPLAPTFGMTETASQVCTLTPTDFLALRRIPENGLFLPPLPDIETRVVDDRGETVTDGTAGEIILRGESIFSGYLDNPEASATSLRDGWLYTGDIGVRRADGALNVLERRSDLIVTGGENVYPAEIEAVLKKHPAVVDVAVVGIPDPRWGRRVAAGVVAREEVAPDQLERFVRERLAGYKVPRTWLFLVELPCTSTGKIRRESIRKLLNESTYGVNSVA